MQHCGDEMEEIEVAVNKLRRVKHRV